MIKRGHYKEYFYSVVQSIPSGSTVHLTEEHSDSYVSALIDEHKIGCIVAFRDQASLDFLDEFTGSYHVFSLLPENLPIAKEITDYAALIGASIYFEEGLPVSVISQLQSKACPPIVLPLPSDWNMAGLIEMLSSSKPLTFIPYPSATEEEMQRLARMCQVGKCELALDKRHTREQVIAVASSLPSGASLSLSTDQQDLRLQVAERMQPGCQLHLSHIESARELNDILSSSQDGVTVVLPRQMGKYVKQFQQRGIAPYTLSTSSDGSFCIAKTLCALAELAEKWALPIGFEPRVLRREKNVLALSSLDP